MSYHFSEVVPLGSLLETPPQNGYSPICPNDPTGKWVLGLAALNGQGLDLSEAKPAPADDLLVDRFFLHPGDFLISRSNTIDKVGRAGVFRGGLENCSYPDLMMRFRPDPSKIYPNYLEVYLRSDVAVKYIQSHATGTSGSMKKINQGIVESIPVLLPNPSDQERIAAVHAMWDNAIEKTERLIEAKKMRFSWVLNRLINQGSEKCEWRRVKLGEVVEINKGQQLNVADMVDAGEYYALNGGTEPSGFTNNWNTPENTITISEGGNSCGFVNFNTEKFWCGGHCYAINDLSNEVSNKYLYHFLKAHERSLMSMRVGSGLPNIQKKDLHNFSITFPPLSDQKIIAETLNTARQEIELLKKQAEAYRKQKRGLMQKLLTGEWRVKSDKEVI
jgi:type I restriction enzyme S subunit